MENLKFEELKGTTISSIVNKDNEKLIFTTATGEKYMLYHDQDCCESVNIEEIHGDLDDLLNSPILLAEELIYNDETPKDVSQRENYDDSFCWTFYKLSTIKGSVTIRWLGESNGYYSESVDFVKITEEN